MGNHKYIETWVPIFGCQGYEISTLGNVRSYRKTKSGEISIFHKPIKKGYSGKKKKYEKVLLRVDGKSKSFLVHRLVAETFIPNYFKKPQVNHIDNNPLNNTIDNLEWVTNSENQIHRFKLAGRRTGYGLYIYKNRTTFRVEKKGVINKCYNTLKEAQTVAQQFY